jgi:hypothetical protein
MATKVQLKVVEHKNNLGQTIKPGDEVVIVTTGYSHRVSISKGEYLGKKNNGCSCRVVEHRTKYRFKETGEELGWWYDHATKRGVMPTSPKHPGFRRGGYRYGTPEYAAEVAENQKTANAYQAAYAEYNRQVAEVGKDYEAFKVPYNRYTTLQLNRIYKLDTSVFDIEL